MGNVNNDRGSDKGYKVLAREFGACLLALGFPISVAEKRRQSSLR